MVVGQHHGAGISQQGVFHHLPHGKRRAVRAALRQLFAAEQLSLGVKARLIQRLLPLVSQQFQKEPSALVHAVEDLFPAAAARRALLHRRKQRQKQRRALADALHPGQFLRAGTEHVLQRAEFLQQPVGCLVGVPAGYGVIQQQLQHLVVGKAVQPVLTELLLLPCPVAVVQAHSTPPPPANV